jgi:hypothetical protein
MLMQKKKKKQNNVWLTQMAPEQSIKKIISFYEQKLYFLQTFLSTLF